MTGPGPGTGPSPGPGLAARLARLTGTEVTVLQRVGGQHQFSHYRVTLAGGQQAFAKVANAEPGADASGGPPSALPGRVSSPLSRSAGPPEPPSRVHGDLWSGNVLWSGGRGWLIDPAAHGGHRETDLAMLALFGAPRLDRIIAAYTDAVPLASGWRERVPLHQLHPLVHACLFGPAYADAVQSAARSALAAA